MKKKILAVASIGGHWIQLLRIAKPLEQVYDVVYMSTHVKCQTMVEKHRFHCMPDFNRDNVWKMFVASFKVLAVLLLERPSAVITTGAAPGLLTIAIARFLFIRTIWIDSVANVKNLSGCGRLARYFSKHVYTQWPDLAGEHVSYVGNVFGNQEDAKE